MPSDPGSGSFEVPADIEQLDAARSSLFEERLGYAHGHSSLAKIKPAEAGYVDAVSAVAASFTIKDSNRLAAETGDFLVAEQQQRMNPLVMEVPFASTGGAAWEFVKGYGLSLGSSLAGAYTGIDLLHYPVAMAIMGRGVGRSLSRLHGRRGLDLNIEVAVAADTAPGETVTAQLFMEQAVIDDLIKPELQRQRRYAIGGTLGAVAVSGIGRLVF